MNKFDHSAGESFCGWRWLNDVNGRRSMASINYYKIFWQFVGRFFDNFLDEFLVDFLINQATVPESLSVVGGGWMKWMEDGAWHRSIITKAVHPWIHIRVTTLVEIWHLLWLIWQDNCYLLSQKIISNLHSFVNNIPHKYFVLLEEN